MIDILYMNKIVLYNTIVSLNGEGIYKDHVYNGYYFRKIRGSAEMSLIKDVNSYYIYNMLNIYKKAIMFDPIRIVFTLINVKNIEINNNSNYIDISFDYIIGDNIDITGSNYDIEYLLTPYSDSEYYTILDRYSIIIPLCDIGIIPLINNNNSKRGRVVDVINISNY